MNDIEELRIILGIMLYSVYTDRIKDIIKSLKTIKNDIDLISHEYNLPNTESEDIFYCLINSIAKLCIVAKIPNE